MNFKIRRFEDRDAVAISEIIRRNFILNLDIPLRVERKF